MVLGDSTFKLEVDFKRDYHRDVAAQLKFDRSTKLVWYSLMLWVDSESIESYG